MVTWDFEAAVIGGGPGGLVSALYLRRFLRETIIVNSGQPRAAWIPKTHNLLGYRGGVSGGELLSRLHGQIREVGTARAEGMYKVQRISGGFRLHGEKDEFTARKVILATGMEDVQPPLENLVKLRNKGFLRYCPVCDAFEHRNRKLAVLAQDDHGLRATLFLRRFTRSLDVIWPTTQRVPRELREACDKEQIRIHRGALLAAEEKGGGKRGLWLAVKTEEDRLVRMGVDACYVALGSVVHDFAFRHMKKLERSQDGFLIADEKQRLSIPGLYAVGDCVQGLAQIAVAAGQAAVAATQIHNTLRSED